MAGVTEQQIYALKHFGILMKGGIDIPDGELVDFVIRPADNRPLVRWIAKKQIIGEVPWTQTPAVNLIFTPGTRARFYQDILPVNKDMPEINTGIRCSQFLGGPLGCVVLVEDNPYLLINNVRKKVNQADPNDREQWCNKIAGHGIGCAVSEGIIEGKQVVLRWSNKIIQDPDDGLHLNERTLCATMHLDPNATPCVVGYVNRSNLLSKEALDGLKGTVVEVYDRDHGVEGWQRHWSYRQFGACLLHFDLYGEGEEE